MLLELAANLVSAIPSGRYIDCSQSHIGEHQALICEEDRATSIDAQSLKNELN